MFKLSRIAAATLISIVASPAFAAGDDAHVAKIEKILPEIVSAIVQDDVVATLNATNAKRDGLTQDEIDRLEATWQQEIDSTNRPLVDSVVGNPLSERMRQVIDARSGLITEIGVIDAVGLSIAQSSRNSDIWQGEEPKWRKTYLVGPDAVFIDEVEFDKSTQSFQSQANFTVKDPVTGQPIGAVTVGINMDAL
jgi:hypothetical protein